MHHHPVDAASLKFDQTIRDLGSVTKWPLLLGIAGIVAAIVAAVVRSFSFDENALDRFMFAYLHNYLFFLTIAQGALFFIMLQHVTRAGWSVTVRRVSEMMAATMWCLAVLFLPILVAVWLQNGVLFRWTDAEYVAAHELVAHKSGYLSPLWFTVRAILYFGIWIFLAQGFYRRSVEQDRTGDIEITRRFEGRSAIGILACFLTVSFASVDWAMSLDAEWFSTIFGVYIIIGGGVAFFASLWLVIHFMQGRGVLRDAVTIEHQHDIGKAMFMALIFWAYIAFSQYLLYWYGDIPEETQWYLRRQQSGWQWIATALIFVHFIIPFFGVMSRHVKRNRMALSFWCVWMLAAHWLDLYYVVMPQVAATQLPFGLIDIFCFLGIGGLVTAGLLRTAGDTPLLPQRDPRMHEALAFQNF